MAKAAAQRADDWREILRLIFVPAAGRTEFALRVAFICVATTLVGEIYRLPPDLALAVYLVFFMNKADRMTGVIIGIAMTVLFTFCLLVTLGVTILVIDHSLWKVLSVATLSVFFLFIGSASVLRPVGGIVALLVGYVLDVLTGLPLGEAATRGVIYGWLFVGLPAPLSILINLVMAPSPRQLVQRDLAKGLRIAAELLNEPDDGTRREARATIGQGYQEIATRLKLVEKEHTAAKDDVEALKQAALSLSAVVALAELADRDPEARPPAAVRAPIAATLEAMAAIFADGGYPVEIEPPECDVTALSPRAAAITSELRTLISDFANPPPVEVRAATAKPAKHGFFRPDAWTNPEHVRFALRTTGAAMTCYLLYTLLAWSTIHTCFITCYVVSLTTIGDSTQKLLLRIAGCLVGAAIGLGAIIVVVPNLTTIPELLTLVFLGAFVSAWVAGGSPRIAYAGFQMAFAFFLCVIQGNKPGFDMVTARDRVIGVLLGNAVSYVFLTRIWPMSVGQRITQGFTAVLRHLRDLAAAGTRHEGQVAAANAHVGLAQVQSDLHLIHLEPAHLRPEATWIEHHEKAASELSDLCEILVIGTGAETQDDVAVRDRLDALADAVAGHAPAREQATNEHTLADHPPRWEPFRSAVERDLDELEDDLTEEREAPVDGMLAHS